MPLPESGNPYLFALLKRGALYLSVFFFFLFLVEARIYLAKADIEKDIRSQIQLLDEIN